MLIYPNAEGAHSHRKFGNPCYVRWVCDCIYSNQYLRKILQQTAINHIFLVTWKQVA